MKVNRYRQFDSAIKNGLSQGSMSLVLPFAKPVFLWILLLLSLVASTSVWAQISILTFGDSITSGVDQDAGRTRIICPANGGVFPTPYACNGNGAKNAGGYQPSTRSRLAAQGVSANLYNWGFAGEESDQLLARIFNVMATRPTAEYVFIMVGVNDVNESNFSTSTTVFNVSRIIDHVIADGRIPVLGTVTPWLGSSTFDARVRQINTGIKAYANSLEIPIGIADHYTALIGNFGFLNSGDGLHIDISRGGNSIVASGWVTAFNQGNANIAAAAAARAARAALPSIILLLD